MGDMYFSAGQRGFFDGSRKSLYESANNWPADAVSISDDDASTYAGPPPQGHHLGADKKGRPCWVAIEPEPADVRRAGAINWLDATADRIRAADRSVGQYLDAEYQIVLQALEDYRASPDSDMPEAIQSYAAAEGLTVPEAAQQIAEAAARADELLQAVRRIRLAGKAAIRDASDDADFDAIATEYVGQLEQLIASVLAAA